MSKTINLYSDGSCLGNPGRGGYGVILEYKAKDYTKELSQGYTLTTNNRMEILGVIIGLRAIKEPCNVEIFTDSQYVINAIKKQWLTNWQKNGWKTANKKDVKNKDLWEELYIELQKHKINFNWIKGHSGHPMNERCDELAKLAAEQKKLLEDTGYIPE